MEPSYGSPRRNDERNAWLPLVAVVVLIAVLFVAVLLVFRRDDNGAEPTGTLPASFPDETTVPTTPATTTPPTVAPTLPVVVVPTFPPATDEDGGEGIVTSTTQVEFLPDASDALDAYATQAGASETSDVVPIGADLFAMAIVSGRGRLLRWDGRAWEVADLVDPPGTMRSVDTVDVTGDGIRDFIIGLAGLDQPGGVYSRATFEFQFLPFNTVTGLEDFVDGLQVRLGKLQSPFRDASGTRTLTWTWTGQMFETR
jgi:hypothetical protein